MAIATVTRAIQLFVPGAGTASFAVSDVVPDTSAFFLPLVANGAATVSGAPVPPTPVFTDTVKVQTGSIPTDGQTFIYSTTLGCFVLVAPTGASELASAVNITGTPTNCSAAGGVGTAVDIPGATISVPNSGGRPVTIRFQCNSQQSVAGTGVLLFNLVETTAGSVSLTSAIVALPNNILAPLSFLDTALAEYGIGAVTTTRTFKLQGQVWAPASNSPTIQIFNSSANPTLIRAVA